VQQLSSRRNDPACCLDSVRALGASQQAVSVKMLHKWCVLPHAHGLQSASALPWQLFFGSSGGAAARAPESTHGDRGHHAQGMQGG
jgi:hypothetical protein